MRKNKSIGKKKLKVFHGLVNYGTQSGIFAKELRNQGIDSISVTSFDPFGRLTDLTLRHSGKNLFIKGFNYFSNSILKVKCFFKFNIFHFYFGHSLFAIHRDLPFYKIFNKKVVFHYLGADVQLFQKSKEKYAITNVISLIKNGKEHDIRVLKRLKKENKYADLQIICAPYLSEFVPGAIILPLAINIKEWEFCPKSVPDNDIVIMHSPTNRNDKGTDLIMESIDRLINEGFKIRKLLVENVTHKELKEKYIECDLFVDQLLSGWYGTSAIEAMAIGRPVLCFLREEYFRYINYGNEIPVINITAESCTHILKELIRNKNNFPDLGRKAREFVLKIHNSEILTNTLINLYKTI
jgi:glycosyltransferase involved in cell wall biosynthesis